MYKHTRTRTRRPTTRIRNRPQSIGVLFGVGRRSRTRTGRRWSCRRSSSSPIDWPSSGDNRSQPRGGSNCRTGRTRHRSFRLRPWTHLGEKFIVSCDDWLKPWWDQYFFNHLREARQSRLPRLGTEEGVQKRWSVSPTPKDPPRESIAERRTQLENIIVIFGKIICRSY